MNPIIANGRETEPKLPCTLEELLDELNLFACSMGVVEYALARAERRS